MLSTTAKKAAKSKSTAATPMEVDTPAATADKKGLLLDFWELNVLVFLVTIMKIETLSLL